VHSFPLTPASPYQPPTRQPCRSRIWETNGRLPFVAGTPARNKPRISRGMEYTKLCTYNSSRYTFHRLIPCKITPLPLSSGGGLTVTELEQIAHSVHLSLYIHSYLPTYTRYILYLEVDFTTVPSEARRKSTLGVEYDTFFSSGSRRVLEERHDEKEVKALRGL
jgi:hypothetical protein